MGQSKAQQIQFFEHCLLPRYEKNTSHIDLQAEIDSKLTTYENWSNLDQQYGISGPDSGLYEKSLKHLAGHIRRSTDLDPELEELAELDRRGHLDSPSADEVREMLAD